MLPQYKFDHSARSLGELINWAIGRGDDGYALNLNPPYQRGDVWTPEQQVTLIEAILMGIDIGSVTINHSDAVTYKTPPSVVDGQQRIRALLAFFNGDIAIPTDWVDDREDGKEFPNVPQDYTDEFITYLQMTKAAQMDFRTKRMGVTEAYVGSIEEEARLFDLINFYGVSMTEEDRQRAKSVAGETVLGA